jgi:N-acetylneuraminic acid mutarotase
MAINAVGHRASAPSSATDVNWSLTGSLNVARSGHTATLLRNGKVLVVGGRASKGITNTAELYDPVTGTWTLTGSLNLSRVLFTATLLQNGKVLVTGGSTSNAPSNFGVTDSAEVYDPDSGTWTPIANLNSTRLWHTATLLRNGKVLVVGGWDGSSILESAELYDPETNTWSPTGSLLGQRYGQTATLLQDGRVLVAGGSDDGDLTTALASAELYDPATGTWSLTGGLNSTRFSHTAILLTSGKVVIVGGYNWPPVSFSGAELYDPVTGAWTYDGHLNEARSDHTATLLSNGEVLVAGGFDWSRRFFPVGAELGDPSAATWSGAANLNSGRSQHTATLLPNGKVLVAGGTSTNSTLNSAELYDSGIAIEPNPIDDAGVFVRQHYRDFLNREPDRDGFAFWTNDITACGGEPECVEVKRINDSAAFFLSIEFQETGYEVYRMYKAAYGNLPDAPVPIRLDEFLPDARQIGQGVVVNQAGWEQALENNKQAFSVNFTERPRFISAFPVDLTADEFVDRLNNNAGNPLSPTERDQLVSDLAAGAKSRAEVLRSIVENENLIKAEFNRAFVLMQYFGYLRRNPNDAPEPRLSFEGYNFWLAKLDHFEGNFMEAEMIKAFITSAEYRQRFAQ